VAGRKVQMQRKQNVLLMNTKGSECSRSWICSRRTGERKIMVNSNGNGIGNRNEAGCGGI
jgi:hypothetical protein